MTLADRLLPWRRPRSERALEPPAFFAGVYRGGLTSGVSNQPSAGALLRALSGWPAIAARAISQRVGSLEIEVVRRTEVRAGTVEDEILDAHPLREAFRANPVFTERQILSLLGYWLAHQGDAYLLKVTDRLRLTRELWPLAPDRVELVTDPDVVVRGYVYHADGGDFSYRPEEIVRIFQPDPANPFAGLGALGPQALTYDADLFIAQTVRSHYENDATPKVVLKAEAGAALPKGDVLARWEKDWRQRYGKRIGTTRGVPAFLPPGFDAQELAAFGGVAEQADILDRLRDRLLTAYGVPRSILGDVVDVNRAAAETNQFVFDAHTITPLANLLADAFTRYVARDYDPDLLVRFAPFVVEDKDFVLKQEQQDLAAKVRNVNQVREDRGLDPVEWGEEPIGSFGDVPYRPDLAADLAEDDPAAFDDDESDEDEPKEEPRGHPRAPVRLADGPWSAERAWARVLRAERRYVPAFERGIRRVLAEQRDTILAEIAEREPRSRDHLDELMRPETWGRLFRRFVEPIRRTAFLETAEATMQSLDAGPFQLQADASRRLDHQGAELVSRVNETTRRRLKQSLLEGFAEGEGQDQIAARVREVFRVRRDQARTIARTEVLRATQSAQIEGFSQSGLVERKRWNTSLDDAVRDTHAATDGQIALLSEPFRLGDGEVADAPGVGHGGPLSAGNAINCRCFVTPVFEGESDA